MTNVTPIPSSTGAFITEDSSVKMEDPNIKMEENGLNKPRLENITPN